MFKLIKNIELRKKAIEIYVKNSIYTSIKIFLVFILTVILTCFLFYLTLNSSSENFKFFCFCFSILFLIFILCSGIIFILDLGISIPEIIRLLKYKKEIENKE